MKPITRHKLDHEGWKETRWNLLEALDLVRQIVPVAASWNCGVGLAGSVLTKGASDKDVDIIIMPFKTVDPALPYDFEGFRRDVDKSIGTSCNWQNRTPHHPGDTKEVWFTRIGGKRVDFFFLK